MDEVRRGSKWAVPLGGKSAEAPQGTTSERDQILHLTRSLDDAPVGLCYIDRDLRYVHINEWLARINGLSVKAHIGKTLQEVIPHIADGVVQQFQAVLDSGEPIISGTVEAETPAHPGVKRMFEHYCYPNTDADGTVLGLSLVVLDVTEREEGKRNIERWAHIFEHAEMPIIISASDGTIDLVNPAAARLYGAPASEFLGRNIMHLYAAEVRDEVESYSRTVSELGHYSFESRHERRDGTVFDVHVTVTTVRGDDGNVSYRVANILDTSKQKRLEAQFHQAQKMESLGILAGGIAHDFNNILAVIVGNTDLALAGFDEPTSTRYCLEQIQVASERASELVNQMLNFSGDGDFAVANLDLNELVMSTADLLHSVISKRAVLRFSLSRTPVHFQGDAATVRQVIMNLITNASDAIGAVDGTITLRTGHTKLDSSDIEAAPISWDVQPGPFVYILVSDTGGGMDADVLSKIFDPFFSTKVAGRGLGLAAILGIVRRHEGVIRVTSEPGAGSIFTLYFPVPPASAADTDTLKSDLELDAESVKTVLVVDDESTVLQVTRRMLEALGYSVLTATDGRDCLAVYQANSRIIDLVVLDLTMPHMGGEEAFAELRRISPDIRAILMSGYHKREASDRLGNKDFAGFLKKPFTLAEMSRQVKRAFAD